MSLHTTGQDDRRGEKLSRPREKVWSSLVQVWKEGVWRMQKLMRQNGREGPAGDRVYEVEARMFSEIWDLDVNSTDAGYSVRNDRNYFRCILI
jgi:hypothetical protein